MKIQNSCTLLESATALHDTHKWCRIDLCQEWATKTSYIEVDGETIVGHLPCEISSIINLTLPREQTDHITGNADFGSSENEFEYVIH